MARTTRSASSAVLTMGAMMPAGPRSNARLISTGSLNATRTTGAAGVAASAWSWESRLSLPPMPCSMSSTTQSKPELPAISAVRLEPSTSHVPTRISPSKARRRMDRMPTACPLLLQFPCSLGHFDGHVDDHVFLTADRFSLAQLDEHVADIDVEPLGGAPGVEQKARIDARVPQHEAVVVDHLRPVHERLDDPVGGGPHPLRVGA